jgi:hypothetical protein
MGFIPNQELPPHTLSDEEKRSIDEAVYFLYDSAVHSAFYEEDRKARSTEAAITVTRMPANQSSRNEVLKPGETIDPRRDELVYFKIK